MATAAIQQKRVGLGYWMQEVLVQCENVAQGFQSGPVHDLRTALRRCRSMADGIMVFDSAPAWKRMKKAGRQLFRSLGALRDLHVLQEWVEKLAPPEDPVAKRFRERLSEQEQQLEQIAAIALQGFDRKQWSNWAQELPARAARIPLDSPEFKHLALERWHEAHALHQRALRNRSNVSFHQLRIGIKRLRYSIENFLPSLHEAWGRDLKEMQDVLGEVHDLDVFWETAANLKIFTNSASRKTWRDRVLKHREQRLLEYRKKMLGRDSLWSTWRAGLPQEQELRHLGFERLKIWSSFLDPSIRHSRHVADLALQLFDGLPHNGIRNNERERLRYVLRAAALMHDVGHSRGGKGHHKQSARLIRGLVPPLGWTADELKLAALIARYHRGALPRDTQRTFSALSQSKRRTLEFLAGILRLACACDREHDGQIRRIKVESVEPVLAVRAEGYAETTPLAEHLAAARHLLEIACRVPVFVMPAGDQQHAA
jgi:CHAD domain-containing protein